MEKTYKELYLSVILCFGDFLKMATFPIREAKKHFAAVVGETRRELVAIIRRDRQTRAKRFHERNHSGISIQIRICQNLFFGSKCLLFGVALLSACADVYAYRNIGDDEIGVIQNLVNQMSPRELLGQKLMLGYHAQVNSNLAEASNRGLEELVKKYKLGSVILFSRNFPRLNSRELYSSLNSSIRSIKRTAFDSQSDNHKVPLLIAIDQEGGGQMELRRGANRTPDPMFIGATGSPDMAYSAGSIIGSELASFGINMALAPVADINNNDDQDVVGKRAFAAHRDLVSPMAACFMKGLQSSKVLSVGKHFPGHGDAPENPHFKMAYVKSWSIDQFHRWDLKPFSMLADHGVDGLMTAHLIVGQYDSVPITISEKAIKFLREDYSYRGLILTDDIANMMGILDHFGNLSSLPKEEKNEAANIQRFEVTKRAIEAGSDITVFATIDRVDSARNPERTITPEEFRDVFNKLLDHFSQPSKLELLRKSVSRVLIAKAALVSVNQFNDFAAWHDDQSFNSHQNLLSKNRERIREIMRSAVVLVKDREGFISFGNGQGPLSQGRVMTQDRQNLLIISPVFKRDTLTESIINSNSRWFSTPNIKVKNLVYGWKQSALEEASDHWGQPVKRFFRKSDQGEIEIIEDAVQEKAQELAVAANGKDMVLFGVVTRAQVAILEHFLERINNVPVYVLLSKEPYFVPKSIYQNRNVSIIFSPTLPDESELVKILYGQAPLQNKIGNLPFSIKDLFDREKIDPTLVPTKTCDLKRFQEYYEQAWSLYRNGDINKSDLSKASLHFRQALVANTKAIHLARNKSEIKDANRQQKIIDQAYLEILPQIE